MKQTTVDWLVEQMKKCNMTVSVHNTSHQNVMDFYKAIEQAKKMEKEHELKTKIICWKAALQFINDNYMVELINIRIYNMEVELETFKSE